jgi:hypothetical protein
VPPSDTTVVLSQVNSTTWQFTPANGLFGEEYLVELTETVTSTVDAKSFGIRSPNAGLLLPAFGSRAPNTVHYSSTTGEKNAAASIATQNEGAAAPAWAGWHPFVREIFDAVESIYSTSTDTARKEVIWRPTFSGNSSTVFGTFAEALAAALQSSGDAVIILDPSLSSTFALPNSTSDGDDRVSIEGPKTVGTTITITFNTNSMLTAFTGITAHPGTAIVLNGAAAGAEGTFFYQDESSTHFTVSGNVSRSGAGNRFILKDESADAATSVERYLTLNDFRSAGAAGLFASINKLHVIIRGPLGLPAVAGMFVNQGSQDLIVELGGGVKYDATAWSTWTPGTVTLVRGSTLQSIGLDSVVSANWPEGSPAHALAAIATLAARIPVVEAFVNPLVFNRDKWMFVTGGAGVLNISVAASGHSTAVETTIRIWILATATYTDLTLDAGLGQDGDPVANFDPSKGYQLFISRVTDGSSTTFVVSGKVVLS